MHGYRDKIKLPDAGKVSPAFAALLPIIIPTKFSLLRLVLHRIVLFLLLFLFSEFFVLPLLFS